MIVNCPSCSARHTMPESNRASGSMAITCRACGHRWTEIETIEIEDIPSRAVPRVIDHDDSPEIESRRLTGIAREAERRFRESQSRRQRSLRNWAAYAVFLLTPIAAAAIFPETVVSAAPITIKAYERLGYDINIYGLELRRVERQHAIVNGTRVLSVKGDILNVADDVRKLPWLRFALEDDTGKELYTWTLDTTARPLRPGELTGFTTRVAAPPETAHNLKIRFAKASEIGSNGGS
jgi:predicted Zn finger-like uncharacterized protein